ncbi:MAG: class I fructose-bisphosphate aldolase [Burkholderiales bacterium]
MSMHNELAATIAKLTEPGKGILAADESMPTITKRFTAVGIESTDETRRAYRNLLFTAPDADRYLAGVILFEETLDQKGDDGTPLTGVLSRRGILPGIKVDKGTVPLPNADGDLITQGLDGLGERLKAYKAKGARFAKWREVYSITDRNPTPLGIEANAEVLARYATICQDNGIVPIVEPEVLLDGDHTLERCFEVTDAVLHAVFHALHRHRAVLEYLVLKPNMVVPGKAHTQKASPEVVARATLDALKRNVPSAVRTINFLSGGQTPVEATANLNAMNAIGGAPWVLSFSYARALQDDTMRTWAGRAENVRTAQDLFRRRLKMNSLARDGKWNEAAEKAA